jgi:hypothetical protein
MISRANGEFAQGVELASEFFGGIKAGLDPSILGVCRLGGGSVTIV